ncbi:D-serine ammonia-lyase [Geosporobacter ferrireducens]|uniref:Probable D-serine dehydratase n=1 Tax=Geosporobacter ferrireducens TaxID=1424294 RepID=A0A1D8GMV0_9FIRM|nr:D-serine ammonia-lyase [Geosporobacter ferrireducens]AOT72162.1 D-serine ammonia-lyase [Geosporobacter ferrireducens]MTI56051.1 D-serine ammonia-lyase [Geosporobacter ferrireducens]
MRKNIILGKAMETWEREYPLLKRLKRYEKLVWLNPALTPVEEVLPTLTLSEKDVMEAEKRWQRFAPLLTVLFPETASSNGLIESPLLEIEKMKRVMERHWGFSIPGKLYIKCDNQLPIAGSIKARGGIYEVLKHAEQLAIENNLLSEEEDYCRMASKSFKDFYSQYAIAVGSTGNLGLSIGIIGAALGFRVTVHMSADAKTWKKKLLREKGVTVIEYASDYSKAVELGRKQSEGDPKSYFVDDEQSKELFLGYSVAAYRLKEQLEQQNISVNESNPLIVYLPCGVGGAPGGIAFGLKLIFGEHVHCYFAEPTHSPCMLMGLMTGKNEGIKVQEFGIDNITDADGLAVGAPSALAAKVVGRWIEGIYTVDDEELYPILALLKDQEDIQIEPSASAAFLGPVRLFAEDQEKPKWTGRQATHIAWATGGIFVPLDHMEDFYNKGKKILEEES